MALTWMPWNVAIEAGAVVGAAGIAAQGSSSRWISSVGAFARELAIVLGLYALWLAIGTISVVKVDGAMHAGTQIWNIERAIGLPNERSLQHVFLHSSALIQACNVYYAIVHLPSMLIFLLWLWFFHRPQYRTVRNLVALSTLGCLILQMIPVAPPRLVPSLHVIDTPAMFGQAVYPSFGKNGPAQLSAMPSVHVTWAVIVGVTIVLVASSRGRWFALAHPVVTTLVVVVTGNHYWLDAIVAIDVIAIAMLIGIRGPAAVEPKICQESIS